MRSSDQRSQHLFIVRMWLEPDDVADTPQWRGSVRDSLTQQQLYFTQLGDLLDFIAAKTTSTRASSIEQEGEETEERPEFRG